MFTPEQMAKLKNKAKQMDLNYERVYNAAVTCVENGLDPKGYILFRTSDEIKSLLKICADHGLDPQKTRCIFRHSPKDAEDIITLLNAYNIPLEASIFDKYYDQLEASIEYVATYGKGYLTPSIIMISAEKLQASMPAVRKLGLLPRVNSAPSILKLAPEEIAERYGVLYECVGVSPYGDTKYSIKSRLHPIFSFTEPKYVAYCQSYGISAYSRQMQREKYMARISKDPNKIL